MEKVDVYLLTGNVGTGKTTTANKLFAERGIVSLDRDEVREQLGIGHYDPADSARIDEIIWNRLKECVSNGISVSMGTASAMKLDRRLLYYDKFREISCELGKEIQIVLVECDCDQEEAKKRISMRPAEGSATSDPEDYDMVASRAIPIGGQEIGRNDNVSFLRFDTQRSVVEAIAVRDGHRDVVKDLVTVLTTKL